jgi:GT2 family glycosyltransferase
MSSNLSVVIPTHSTRELTLRCIASVLRADTSAEIIVVDDASTDDTVAAIGRRFPHVEVLLNESSLGFSRTANRGLKAAEGDTLLLLNSDTEVSAPALAAARTAFDRDPELGVAGAELRYPDQRPQWSAGREPTGLWLFGQASGLPALLGRIPGYRVLKPVGRGARSSVDWVSGAAMAIRREVWQNVGPFDEGYRFYCQDLEFCLAARDAGWEVAVVKDFEVTHHHGATISDAGGSAAPYHPELMWTDLVRFARRRGGDEAARKTKAALRAGAKARLLGRRLTGLIQGKNRPATWEKDTAAFEAGLRGLDEIEL